MWTLDEMIESKYWTIAEVKDGKFDLEKFELSYIKTSDAKIKKAEGKDIEKI